MNANDLLKLHDQVVESWNRHDAKKFVSFLDENVVLTDTGYPEPLKGKPAVEEYFNTLITAFPDFSMKTLNTVIAGDYIAAEVECRGTHNGPYRISGQPEIPATHKRLITRMSFFAKVRNGKTVEVRTYPDKAGALMQLGIHELLEAHA